MEACSTVLVQTSTLRQVLGKPPSVQGAFSAAYRHPIDAETRRGASHPTRCLSWSERRDGGRVRYLPVLACRATQDATVRETGGLNVSAEPSLRLEPVGRSNSTDRMPLKPRDASERRNSFNGVSSRLDDCLLANGCDATRLQFSVDNNSTSPATTSPAWREYARSASQRPR